MPVTQIHSRGFKTFQDHRDQNSKDQLTHSIFITNSV